MSSSDAAAADDASEGSGRKIRRAKLIDLVPDAEEVARFEVCISSLPYVLQPSPDAPFLVGGALRRMFTGGRFDGADLDLFFPSRERHQAAGGAATNEGWRVRPGPVAWLKEARCSGFPPVQLVSSAANPTPEKLIEMADFTICQFVFDGVEVIYTQQALDDARARILRDYRFVDALGSGLRAAKYQAQGFRWADAADFPCGKPSA
jgi:hypothetical protein